MEVSTASRNTYDTFLVSLYIQGREHLIPGHLKKIIPSSTASGFRSRNSAHYFGSELRALQENLLDHHELMLKHVKLKRVLSVVTSVWLSFARIKGHAVLKQKELREWVVDQVQYLTRVMPRATALKLAGLSPAAFYYSLGKLKNACTSSPLELCRRRHPLQLSIREIEVIRKLMLDTSKACWPALSIFHHARRNNLLLINQSTFYKYLRLLGMSRKQPFKKAKKVGLQANRPNEFLHVDTTFFTLPDGIKMATVFVSDNFSRHILGFHTSIQHGFENVKAALQLAFNTIRKHYPDLRGASMVVDGGGENNTLAMEGFLISSAPPVLTKLIAQRNIAFSNSPVEAVNKIFKRYLRHWEPQNITAFQSCVESFARDYTHFRPHGSLDGLTPFEAYTGKELPHIPQSVINQARKARIEANKKQNCTGCR